MGTVNPQPHDPEINQPDLDPQPAPGRSPGWQALEWQLLWHRVVVATDDELVRSALAAMVQNAHHDEPPDSRLGFRITRRTDGTWDLTDDTGAVANPATTVDVLDHVFRSVYQACFDAARDRGWVRLHGALVEVAGRTVLLTGDSGAGKTTLTLRLGMAGATVQSDETTLVRQGLAIGVPRRFHAKADTPGRLERLREPSAGDLLAGTDLLAVDPRAIGIDWCVRSRRVDHVVCLSEVGLPARTRPIPSGETLARVLPQVLPSGEPHRVMARELAALLAGARSWALEGAGDPRAVALLEALGPAVR